MKSKKLYRNINDCIVGGVCNGLSEYYNLDTSLIRFLFIIFALFTSFAAIEIYIILWIIIPENIKK